MSLAGCTCGICPSCVKQSIEKAERALKYCTRVYNAQTFNALQIFQAKTNLISEHILNLNALLAGNIRLAPRVYFALSTTNKSTTPCAVASLDRRDFNLTLMDSFVARILDFCDLRKIAQPALSSLITEISIIDIRGTLVLVECSKLENAVWILIDYTTQSVVASSHTIRGFMGIVDPTQRAINSKLPSRFFPDGIYVQGTVRRGKFLIQIQGDNALVHDTTSDTMTQVHFPEYKISLHKSIDYEIRDGRESLIFRGNDAEQVRRFRVPYADISG